MFTRDEIDKMKKEAEVEINLEKRREKIDAIKSYLRKPLIKRIFPYKLTIKIERIDDGTLGY